VSRFTLFLGGVRSGKSARALEVARTLSELPGANARVLFVATGQPFDAEMTRRIDTHRRERPSNWETLEVPIELASTLAHRLGDRTSPVGVVVIDCLTLWVSNVLCALTDDQDAEAELASRALELLQVRETHRGAAWIVVSNEVGLGVVPPTPLGRRYRDALGRVNQLVAAAADDVILMVAGFELALKRDRASGETATPTATKD